MKEINKEKKMKKKKKEKKRKKKRKGKKKRAHGRGAQGHHGPAGQPRRVGQRPPQPAQGVAWGKATTASPRRGVARHGTSAAGRFLLRFIFDF